MLMPIQQYKRCLVDKGLLYEIKKLVKALYLRLSGECYI